MSDIFISYASEDRDLALKYYEAFRHVGFDVWWDYDNMNAGGIVHSAISKALDESNCVVVLWSKHSIESKWVNDEAHVGKSDDKLIPIIVDKDIIKRDIPALLRIIHSADLSHWDGNIGDDKFKKLVGDILKITPPSLQKPRQQPAPPKDTVSAKTAVQPEKPLPSEKPKHPEQIKESPREVRRTQVKTPPQPESKITPQPDNIAEVPQGIEEMSKPTPWLLILILPLLTMYLQIGSFKIEFYLFAIPVAAWLGSRYGRGGFLLTVIGFIPMLFGTPKFDGISFPIQSGLYITSVFIAYATAYPNRFWTNIESFNFTLPLIAGIFILGFSVFYLKGEFGVIGFRANQYLVYSAMFLVALSGRHIKSTLIIGAAIGFFGMWARSSGITKFSDDLGNGMRYASGFTYDNFAEIATVALILLWGVQIGKVLRGEKSASSLYSTSIVFMFIACWIYAVVHTATSRTMVYSQSMLLMTFLAFAAGLIWQRRGGLILVIPLVITILISFANIRIPISLTDSSSLLIRFPSISSHFDNYVACVVFYFFGLKLGQRLQLSPELDGKRQLPVSGLFPTIRPPASVQQKAYDTAVLWLMVPVLPLLAITYKFSKTIIISLHYLIVPVAAWLAYRYGKKAILPLSIGMITYFVGFKAGYTSFRSSADLYIVALIVAWAIASPAAWQEKLKKFSHSSGMIFTLIVVLSIYFLIRIDAFSFGMPRDYYVYPFILFIIGWAGASKRLVLPLILVPGLIWAIAYMSGFRDIKFDRVIGFYQYYNTIAKVLIALLSFASGVILRHFYDSYQQQSHASWPAGDHRFFSYAPQIPVLNNFLETVTSRKAFYILAVLMGLAILKVYVGAYGIKTILWGDKWIFFLSAFVAGFIWRQLGYQLTFFAIAMAWLLSGAIFPSGGRITFGSTEEIYLSLYDRGGRTFILMALTAFLYCHIGVIASRALTVLDGKQAFRIPAIPPTITDRPVKQAKPVNKSATNKKTYTSIGLVLLALITTGVYFAYQSSNDTGLTQSNLSEEEHRQKVETLITEARESIRKAASVKGEWRYTEKILKNAIKALKNNDLTVAEELATTARNQGELGYKQAVEQKNAGPWMF